MQEVRLASEDTHEADVSAWKRTAFVAWNARMVVAGSAAGTFEQFLKGLGLGPKNELSADDVAYWRDRANENERLAFAAIERQERR